MGIRTSGVDWPATGTVEPAGRKVAAGVESVLASVTTGWEAACAMGKLQAAWVRIRIKTALIQVLIFTTKPPFRFTINIINPENNPVIMQPWMKSNPHQNQMISLRKTQIWERHHKRQPTRPRRDVC